VKFLLEVMGSQMCRKEQQVFCFLLAKLLLAVEHHMWWIF